MLNISNEKIAYENISKLVDKNNLLKRKIEDCKLNDNTQEFKLKYEKEFKSKLDLQLDVQRLSHTNQDLSEENKSYESEII